MQSRVTTTCSKNLVSIYGRRTELVSNLQVDSVFLRCVPKQIGLGRGGASNGSAATKQFALIPIRPGGRQQQNTPSSAFTVFHIQSLHPPWEPQREALVGSQKENS